MNSPGRPSTLFQLRFAIFFVSAGLLAFEISLMRILLIASWHHFAFLVISVVLLGFGASGTALQLLGPRATAWGDRALFALIVLSAVSMPVLAGVAQHVPIEARLVPILLWQQVAAWLAYWLLLFAPFLFGAGAIGLGLMLGRERVAGIYAANLLGSAAGSLGILAAMYVVPPEWLPTVCGVTLLTGAASLGAWTPLIRRLVYAAAVAVVGLVLVLDPPQVRYDPYKFGAYVQRLVGQGSAERVAVRYGPRAKVEAFRGAVFHDLPFLSGAESPPPIAILMADGDRSGSVLRVAAAEQAGVVDNTITAFPYAFAPPRPRIALLGEVGGTNVWLAARHDASEVIAVQPDGNILELLRGPLREEGGGFLDLGNVRAVVGDLRHFIEHTDETFDLVQLAALESLAAGSGGLAGLGQDHLATNQGFSACLRRLSPEGMVTVTRGIQTPPRDNLKLFATFGEALRSVGVSKPSQHVVIVRDFLAVCTMVKRTPFTGEQIAMVREECRRRGLTPVGFPGIRDDELNQPDSLPGPAGAVGDWYHIAAKELLDRPQSEFPDHWPFHIRPATDQSPFFMDFCKLESLGELRRAFGDLWLTRAELGFVFVLAAIVIIATVGGALTVLPILWTARSRPRQSRGAIVGYFTAIGLAYLLLEMTFLSRLTHWVGDPVTTAALTIAAFLCFSGLGSAAAQRVAQAGAVPAALRQSMVALFLFGLLGLTLTGPLSTLIGGWPGALRGFASVASVAPVAFCMGFPMPLALARLNMASPAQVPLAWAVNGFASVVAPPLATAMGMTWGFTVAGTFALLLYAVPILLFSRLPRPTSGVNC